eukprot:gene11304-4115_t
MLNKLFIKKEKSASFYDREDSDETKSPITPRGSPFSLKSISFRRSTSSKNDLKEPSPLQKGKKDFGQFLNIKEEFDNIHESENELLDLSSKLKLRPKQKKEIKRKSELAFEGTHVESDDEYEDTASMKSIETDEEDDDDIFLLEKKEKTSKEKMEEMIITTRRKKTRSISIMHKYESAKNFSVENEKSIEQEKKLFQFVKKNNINAFKDTIENNECLDLNWKNPELDFITLLHASIFSDNFEACEFLVKNNVDIEILDKRERSPLHIACYLARIEIIAILLANGAKVNIKDGFGNAPIHILMKSHHFDLLDALILSGCDLNFKTASGSTLIHDSIVSNDDELLQFLLLVSENSIAEISLNSRDRLGFTPFLKSVSNGNLKSFNLLLKNLKIDKYVTTTNGHNIFHVAANFSKENFIPVLAKFFNEEELKNLLNQQDTLKQKNTPCKKTYSMEQNKSKWKDTIIISTRNE